MSRRRCWSACCPPLPGPSGSNRHPWHVYVPDGWSWAESKKRVGEHGYGAVGIPREEMEVRQRAVAANGDCFGAPTVLGSRTALSHSLWARLRNSLPVPVRGRWPTVGSAEGHVRQRPDADTLRQVLPLCRPAESLDYAMRLHANMTQCGLVGEECIPLPEEKCSCCSESWCEPRGGPRDHDVSA